MHILLLILFQLLQPVFPLLELLIPLIRLIQLPAMHRKRDIPEIEGRRVVGMAGHHAAAGEVVGQSGRQLIDSVAAAGVPGQVDSVAVNRQVHLQQHHQFSQKDLHVRLVPEVPSVGRPSRSHVNAVFYLVQVLLVSELLVIHFFRTSAPSVQRNKHWEPRS
jgi:hypothetical protein